MLGLTVTTSERKREKKSVLQASKEFSDFSTKEKKIEGPEKKGGLTFTPANKAKK